MQNLEKNQVVIVGIKKLLKYEVLKNYNNLFLQWTHQCFKSSVDGSCVRPHHQHHQHTNHSQTHAYYSYIEITNENPEIDFLLLKIKFYQKDSIKIKIPIKFWRRQLSKRSLGGIYRTQQPLKLSSKQPFVVLMPVP